MTSYKYEDLLKEAITMYASGNDNTYIELQFAERGIDDKTINAVISEIKKIRKAEKRKRGIKLTVIGISLLATALIVSIILSYNTNSPYRYVVMWGLGLSGMMTTAKGIVDFLIP